MRLSVIINGLAVVLMFIFIPTAWAQSASMIGGNSLAKECYQASQIAARIGFSSREDLEICNNAMLYGNLRSRDAVATLVNRGVIKAALDDYNGAVADYENAIRMRSDGIAEAYLNRGNIWIMAKQYNRAIEDYQQALDMDVNQSHLAQLNLGLAHEFLSDFIEAKRYYELALASLPDWQTAIDKLNRVNRKLGVIE